MNREELKRALPHASEDFIRRNATARTAGTDINVPMDVIADSPMPSKKRLRQNTKGLNKTEVAFTDYLRAQLRGAQVYAQCVTLHLANGVRYTPDNFAFFGDEPGCNAQAWEVKGFMRDDAAVKVKVAASFFPHVKFRLVTKKKKKDGGGWNIQEVLP